MNSDNKSFTQVLEYLKRDKKLSKEIETRKYCEMCILLHGHMRNSITVTFNFYTVH
jgi:hypothetical protein